MALGRRDGLPVAEEHAENQKQGYEKVSFFHIVGVLDI
jgi:hypothetical protein